MLQCGLWLCAFCGVDKRCGLGCGDGSYDVSCFAAVAFKDDEIYGIQNENEYELNHTHWFNTQ